MNRTTQLTPTLLGLVAVLALAPATLATVCVVPDDSGTAEMPPPTAGADPNCTQGYVSPSDFHEITAGLPPGTSIEIGPEHFEFINIVGTPGGALGGERETFDSLIQLQLQGTGALTGFSRSIFMQLECETETGPRTPGAAVQTFDNEMVQLQGEIFGDPDFLELRIRAGRNFGLPSPGETTLTRLGPPGSEFNVDSFFDIFYEIEFVGAPGSLLDGLSGTTQATVRMQLGDAAVATPGSNRFGLILAVVALMILLSVVMFLRRPRTA